MLDLNLRLKILGRYPTQSDFALAAKMSESKVSRVLRGRAKLTKEEAEKWAELLRCQVKAMAPVTGSEKGSRSKR
jgi:transcriptional regulator with XRE-family HTH domain